MINFLFIFDKNLQDDISRYRHSWPLLSSHHAMRDLQFNPVGNVALTDRKAISMNSFRNIRSQRLRGYSHPSFPDRRWSFSHSP